MKKITLFLVVLAAVAGGYYVYKVRGAVPEPSATTMPLSRGDVVDTVGATGTLEAVETVDVGTQVSGVVQALYADFNSIVRKGQVIARLDPQLIETQIEQQKANVARAVADLERLRVALADAEQKLRRAQQMAEKNLIPRTELETAEVNVRSAEAQIRSSEAALTQARAQLNNQVVNLGYTTITAPIDGIVISRNVDQGQTVASSMNAPTLYVIAADLTKMQVIANIDEADVGRMRPGQVVNFRVDAYPTETFRGEVAQVRLQPSVVQNVVTYSTVISVPNPELKLKPGMTANVTIEIARRNNVLRIPNRALSFRPTNEMFAALNQEVPPELQRGPGMLAGRGGRGGDFVPGGFGAPGGTTPAAAQSAPGAAPAQRAGGPDAAQAAPRGGGPAQEGAGQGRGGFDPNLSPEERQRRMEERLAAMSPEERERLEQRMREGGGRGGFGGRQGGTPGDQATGRGGAQAGAGAAGRQGGGAASPSGETSRALASGATTIDALFAPIQIQERSALAWVFEDRQLKPLRLRLGVSDSNFSEIVNEHEVPENAEVVVMLTTGTESRATPGMTNPQGNPLMGPQRGGPGGRGGGGGRAGGRG
jgi:HlyD family secretion protein